MPEEFDEFMHWENVRNYQRQLMTATDPEQRRMLMSLLEKESARAKEAGWTPLYK